MPKIAELTDERPLRDARPPRPTRSTPAADVDTRTLRFIRSRIAATSGDGDESEGPETTPGLHHAR
jgi:hypothetical protein